MSPFRSLALPISAEETVRALARGEDTTVRDTHANTAARTPERDQDSLFATLMLLGGDFVSLGVGQRCIINTSNGIYEPGIVVAVKRLNSVLAVRLRHKGEPVVMVDVDFSVLEPCNSHDARCECEPVMQSIRE